MQAQEIIPQNPREYNMLLSHNRMIERAINLHKDGYRITPVCETVNGRIKPILGAFVVTNPNGDDYDVDVIAQTCTCQAHRRNHCCKHRSGAYRLGCRQAQEERRVTWQFRHTPRGFARYVEAERLLSAMESARVVCQRRMGVAA